MSRQDESVASNIVVSGLTNCARCGGNHEKLTFQALGRPCGDLTHWAPCPNTGEPLLLKVERKLGDHEAIAHAPHPNPQPPTPNP